MVPHLLSPILLALHLLVGGGGHFGAPLGTGLESASGRPVRVAQAAPIGPATRTTDWAAGEVARLIQLRARVRADKRALAQVYEGQLRQLDRLKRGKASWRRDRQVRSMKAESQATAEKLSRADATLRALDARLVAARQALLSAIRSELAQTTLAPARRTELAGMQRQVAALLRPPPRKIILPDDTLDELADPEELAEQIALIQQAEKELARQDTVLTRREQRYARMTRLREVRDRASEMNDLDDDQVRRGGRPTSSRGAGATSGGADNSPSPGAGSPTGGGSGGDSGGAGGGAPSPDPGTDPTSGSGSSSSLEDSGFEQSSIILADVVDATTIDALRRASRSSDPRARARAAARARTQVEKRLERLQRSRVLIQRHLRALKSQ